MEMIRFEQLSTLSHPQRMAVFRMLMRRFPHSVAAGEVVEALDLKPSTASVYLAALRETQLIRQTRDGRSLRYTADTQMVQSLVGFLINDCCNGRPDLCPPGSAAARQPLPSEDHMMPDRKLSVLFICTGNSARSIMAEALLETLGGGNFDVYSAGMHPRDSLNPGAVRLLNDLGHDTSRMHPKTLDGFQGPDAPPLDFVFTVCDRAANEECPAWPGQPISAHWGIPDPSVVTGTDAEVALAFRHAYGALKHRITAFTALPIDSLDRISLQHAVDEIATRTTQTATGEDA